MRNITKFGTRENARIFEQCTKQEQYLTFCNTKAAKQRKKHKIATANAINGHF